jgi:hypothetical protein
MIIIYSINSNLKNSINNIFKITNDITICDYIFLNYKIKSKQDKIKYITKDNIKIIKDTIELSEKYNKKIIYLCGGDKPPKLSSDIKNIIFLNTSVNKSNKFKNELVIGFSINDNFKEYLENPKLKIGFVGQSGNGREKYLNYLLNSSIETNFIINISYIHKLKKKHIENFYNNINDNLFTFCYRGGGNFSVRFYETLMMGRIPIIIKTDNIFPYEDIINYHKVGLFIEENELNIDNLENIIINYYNNKTSEELLDIQKNNRKIYLEYFHQEKYFDNIFEYIYKNDNKFN